MTSTRVRRDSNDHSPINLSSSNQDMNQIPSVNSASAVTVASVQAALSALQAGQVSLNQLSTLNAQNALWQSQVAVVAADSVTSQNLQGSQLPVSHSDLHSLQAALQQQHFNLQHQLQSFLINQVQIPGQFASIYPNRPMISHQIRSTFPALRENTMDPLSSQRTETESSTITQHFLQMPIISNQNYQRGFYDHMHSRATPSDFLNSHIAENNFEMEQFAKEFKRRRNLLGFTQGDVGLALGKTYGSYFSQTTISRFEAHNLSHKNMSNLKPLLQKWLKDAEVCNTTAVNVCTPTPEIVDLSGKRRKKRTSIKNVIRTSLEFAFRRNSMPGSEDIRRIASNLSLDKEVIRVWFCNRRQKEKYISAGSASGKTGSPRTTSPDLNVEDSEDIVISLK